MNRRDFLAGTVAGAICGGPEAFAAQANHEERLRGVLPFCALDLKGVHPANLKTIADTLIGMERTWPVAMGGLRLLGLDRSGGAWPTKASVAFAAPQGKGLWRMQLRKDYLVPKYPAGQNNLAGVLQHECGHGIEYAAWQVLGYKAVQQWHEAHTRGPVPSDFDLSTARSEGHRLRLLAKQEACRRRMAEAWADAVMRMDDVPQGRWSQFQSDLWEFTAPLRERPAMVPESRELVTR